MNAQCCKRFYGTGYGYRGASCSKPVKAVIDGKAYCAIHHPDAVKKRDEASRKRSADAQAVRNRHAEIRCETFRKAAAYDELVEALREIDAVICDFCLSPKDQGDKALRIARDALAKAGA